MTNSQLRITETDFFGIKNNLIMYLKNQDEFSGYNFETSSLNILLDILAYNTYYNAVYNNVTINEMFLDSAIKRSSIVSIAKHFNYAPKTITSSSCVIEITTTSTPENTKILYLPKYTTFSTNVDGEFYEFKLMEDTYFNNVSVNNSQINVTKSSGPVTIKEGIVKNFTYIYDLNNYTQKFVIPFENVDSSTLVVKVQPSPFSEEEVIYNRATNIIDLNENSKVYFIEENSDGFLEIYFGDGIFGEKLKDSSTIRIEILQSVGPNANGIGKRNSTSVFTLGSSDFLNIDGTINTTSIQVQVKIVQPSYGGSEKEPISSIKLNATRNFTTAERAVTKTDYKNIILKDYPEVSDVIVWGGEENDPPDYGKVFLSLKRVSGSSLSSTEKRNLINSLTRNRNVIGVRVEIVDPNTIYLNLNVSAKIDPIIKNKTTNIQTEIVKTIDTFFSDNVRKFDADFYSAELIESIQNIDESIITNDISVVLEKRFTPNFSSQENYTFDFSNELYPSSSGIETVLTTNVFGYLDSNFVDRDCFLEDDRNGNIMLYYLLGNKKIYINKRIGSIDYIKGKVYLNNFKPTFLINNMPISIYVIPKNKDIIANKKTVLEFDKLSTTSLNTEIELVPYRNK